MASGPLTSWHTDGETTETVTDSIFLGSKITADGDCSHEIKRCLLLGRKAMSPHIKMQRHYFADKRPSSQSYGFSSSRVWMWEMDYKESWAPENWFFWLWCWGRLLRVRWTAKRFNQSILKEIHSEYSLEALMWSWNSNPFNTRCKELTHWERPWCWERLKGTREDKMFGWHHWLNGHEFE